MKRLILILVSVTTLATTALADEDDDIRKAKSYLREAEYQQKMAQSYMNDANYHLSRAESYQRDVDYYERQEDYSRAKTYEGYVKREMESARSKFQRAASAADKAEMYFKWAADALY
ncbi:MAG: hypothetical protein J6B41_07570 [Alistipes sp.]|nr:hypothetical protein [Alistipes sp.]